MNFQLRVTRWLYDCFSHTVVTDTRERNFRFIKEALELVQACNMTKEEVMQLVHYTYNRPPGSVYQEVGGVMVTLAALCHAYSLQMEGCGNIEIERIEQPDVMNKIKMKQLTKPTPKQNR